jgi:hypothetical protein
MQLNTHQNHITDAVPDVLISFIIKRFDQLAEGAEDVPPIRTVHKGQAPFNWSNMVLKSADHPSNSKPGARI